MPVSQAECASFGYEAHDKVGRELAAWLNQRKEVVQLLHPAFEEHGSKLEDIAPYVEDSGEGRWTINEAINENVPTPVIAASLFARFASRDEIKFSSRVAAALRNQFARRHSRTT